MKIHTKSSHLRVRCFGGAGVVADEVAGYGGATSTAVQDVRSGWKWIYIRDGIGSFDGENGTRIDGGGVERNDKGSADMDGDGTISFQEFAQAITSAAFDNSWA